MKLIQMEVETTSVSTNNSKSKKNIFKYNNGVEDIYEDPFEIDWRLQEAVKMIPNIDEIDRRMDLPRDAEGKVLEDIDAKTIALCNDAWHIYVPIIIKVFQLKPFDKKTGEGTTADEAIDIYSSYLAWRYELKKNTE